ncbi:MAG: hypothetical protein QOD75_736 [Blastocatellia bacterium]|jgi:hypothetical protein|nr:hypothetical protein [Blastocatellia bacterium]
MHLKKLKTIVPFLLLVVAACGNKPATEPVIPPGASPQVTPAISRPVSSSDVVKPSVAPVEIIPGRSSEAKVQLSISHGYHVNANPATFPYLIATTVSAGPGKGITVGKPVYPAAVMKQFSFEKQQLSVYEGTATITLPLQAAGNAEKGPQSIPLTVRIQACDDAACYAPAKLDLVLPVTVK